MACTRLTAFSIFETLIEKFRRGVVILVGLFLIVVPYQPALGQISQQQQEQQQREQQQRDQQAREQQQREQQERDQRAREEQQRQEQQRQEQQREQQAREQQQREQQERDQRAREEQQRQEQQREQQAREQQQREQQERDQRAREEQQRQEQQREQQAREQQQREQQESDQRAREEQQRQEQQRQEQQREQLAREQQQQERQQRQQQAREQQQREEQERQRQTAPTPASTSTNGSYASSRSPEVVSKHSAENPGPSRKSSANAGDNKAAPTKDPTTGVLDSDLQRKPCGKEPCAQPTPKPVPPEVNAKACKDKGGSCAVCAPGQSPGKNNSCVPAALAKAATAQPNATSQVCPGGQIWNGIQCIAVGVQHCMAGQTMVGTTCQTDCTSATASAQGYIELLRMARQDKDSACIKDPNGDECRSATLTYDMRLNEYRAILGGVPTECTLPDPISI